MASFLWDLCSWCMDYRLTVLCIALLPSSIESHNFTRCAKSNQSTTWPTQCRPAAELAHISEALCGHLFPKWTECFNRNGQQSKCFVFMWKKTWRENGRWYNGRKWIKKENSKLKKEKLEMKMKTRRNGVRSQESQKQGFGWLNIQNGRWFHRGLLLSLFCDSLWDAIGSPLGLTVFFWYPLESRWKALSLPALIQPPLCYSSILCSYLTWPGDTQ